MELQDTLGLWHRQGEPPAEGRNGAPTRLLLRLLKPLDLSRVSRRAAAGGGTRRGNRLAADPGRRRVQCGEPNRLRQPGQAQAAEAGLCAEGSRRLGEALWPQDRLSAQ